MSEVLLDRVEADDEIQKQFAVMPAGRITVLEALAEETTAISPNASQRSTQVGNGTDAQDD